MPPARHPRHEYIDEFRCGDLAGRLAAAIRRDARPERSYRFMEFCGGHTHAISRYGLIDLLPPNVRMIHGPGCPVCVLPIGRIDQAIRLARDQGAILATYADTLRVPASQQLTLLRAKAQGADIRMVYSTSDALEIARTHPRPRNRVPRDRLRDHHAADRGGRAERRRRRLANFSVLCNHVLTPAAMHAILPAPRAWRSTASSVPHTSPP